MRPRAGRPSRARPGTPRRTPGAPGRAPWPPAPRSGRGGAGRWAAWTSEGPASTQDSRPRGSASTPRASAPTNRLERHPPALEEPLQHLAALLGQHAANDFGPVIEPRVTEQVLHRSRHAGLAGPTRRTPPARPWPGRSRPAHWAHGSSVTYSVATGQPVGRQRWPGRRWIASSSACAVGSLRCIVSLCASARTSPSRAHDHRADRHLLAHRRLRGPGGCAACMPGRSPGRGRPLRTRRARAAAAPCSMRSVIARALDHDRCRPRCNFPSSSSQRERFCSSRWITRLSGRAPYTGSYPCSAISSSRLGRDLEPELPCRPAARRSCRELEVHDAAAGPRATSGRKTMMSSTRLRNSGRK